MVSVLTNVTLPVLLTALTSSNDIVPPAVAPEVVEVFANLSLVVDGIFVTE
jgi:hypothetical protein